MAAPSGTVIEAAIKNGTLDASSPELVRNAIRFLNEKISHSQATIRVIQTNSDNFFLTVNAVFILMMQAGFGFFEAGSVRGKNVVNMLFKNVLDAFFGGMAYWCVGYAFAFGEPCNQFIGLNHFFGSGLSSTLYSHWFFHYSFCVTAATIVSGALAERCEFKAYLFYSLVITGVTYPVITHWAWHSGDDCKGWLNKLGYQDFAGSGVVHLTGGSCALIACLFLGPRLGRFPSVPDGPYDPMPGHNLPFTVLGAFLLFVGFFAFNGGSQASISVPLDGEQAGRAMMNTVLAGSPAAITGMIVARLTGSKRWDLMNVLGSGLAGMVAICAGCNVVEPWAAIFIGVVAALVTMAMSRLMKRYHIDDPVDSVALHLGSGLWGVIATSLFDRDKGVLTKFNKEGLKSLAFNMVGAGAIVAWCAMTCLPVFLVLKRCNWLRVDPSVEAAGMDLVKHGEVAYPEAVRCCAAAKTDGTEQASNQYDEFMAKLRERQTNGPPLGYLNGGLASVKVGRARKVAAEEPPYPSVYPSYQKDSTRPASLRHDATLPATQPRA